jgi:hypothetical protein
MTTETVTRRSLTSANDAPIRHPIGEFHRTPSSVAAMSGTFDDAQPGSEPGDAAVLGRNDVCAALRPAHCQPHDGSSASLTYINKSDSPFIPSMKMTCERLLIGGHYHLPELAIFAGGLGQDVCHFPANIGVQMF